MLPSNESEESTLADYVRLNRTYLPNALLAWLSGVTWFCQFFFFGMGKSKLGKQFDFSSWSIHMAFIVVFLNLWGLAFHEWRGTTTETKLLVWIGILILIGSTIVIGYANYLNTLPPFEPLTSSTISALRAASTRHGDTTYNSRSRLGPWLLRCRNRDRSLR